MTHIFYGLAAVAIGWVCIVLFMGAMFALLWDRSTCSARRAYYEWLRDCTPLGVAFWRGDAE